MWVDGSFRDGRAGYAVLHQGVIYYGTLVQTTTSLQAEVNAVWAAIDIGSYLGLPSVTIYSDSTGAVARPYLPGYHVRHLPRRSTLELELVDHYAKQGAATDEHFQVLL